MNTLLLLLLSSACATPAVLEVSDPRAVLKLSPNAEVVVRLKRAFSSAVVTPANAFAVKIVPEERLIRLRARRPSATGQLEIAFVDGLRTRALRIETATTEICEWTIETTVDQLADHCSEEPAAVIARMLVRQTKERPTLFVADTLQVRARATSVPSVVAESALVYRLIDTAYVLVRVSGEWQFSKAEVSGARLLSVAVDAPSRTEEWLVLALSLADDKPNVVRILLRDDTGRADLQLPEMNLDAQ